MKEIDYQSAKKEILNQDIVKKYNKTNNGNMVRVFGSDHANEVWHTEEKKIDNMRYHFGKIKDKCNLEQTTQNSEEVIISKNSVVGEKTAEKVVEKKVDQKPVVKESGDEKKCFTNLHHHDEYSLRCALGTTSVAVKKLKEYNYTHYAVSNYGEVSGWVNQYFTCIDNKIIPILGIEMFVNNYRFNGNAKKEKSLNVRYESVDCSWEKDYLSLTPDEKNATNLCYNIVLYAKNMDGYFNIIKSHNHSQINGYRTKPMIDEKTLVKNASGIICIAPILSSEISNLLILGGSEELAYKKYELYKKNFDDVYLELLIVDDKNCKKYNETTIKFAQKYGCKCVITCNSHYLLEEDKDVYDVWQEMGRNSSAGFSVDLNIKGKMHYRSREEITELFHKQYKSEIFTEEVFNEAMHSVEVICKSIDTLPIDTTPKLPKFKDAEEVIRKKSFSGLNARGLDHKKEYIARLEYELDNVIRAGFADYFLFLEDITTWCKKNHIQIGFGRGSGSGSLVLYCLGITQVDPLKYNLLFERFLDAARLDEVINKGGKVDASLLPDVDIDFSDRDAVKAYLVEKYGKDNTCSIGSIGRMKNKSVLQDLCRLYKVDASDVTEVTKGEMKLITDEEEHWTLEQLKETFPALKGLLDKHKNIEKYFEKIRGTVSYWGKHAGGVLVSDQPLTDQLPVRIVNEKVVSCWAEGISDRELGRLGFIKMDILGIETLNQINMTLDLIRDNHRNNLDMYTLDINDARGMYLANECDTMGIFQFESPLTKRVFEAMGGIKCFEDYAAASALMRPSALQAQLHEKFGERRRNPDSYTIPDCLKSELGPTYGLTIYQESAYHVAKKLCDFSIVEAYKFMKLLYKGKMKDDVIPYWREKFMKGAQPKIDSGEVTIKYVEEIFEDLLKFQGYGFCMAHATAYAMFSAAQLYLKAHFNVEFICSLLIRTPRTKEDKSGQSLLQKRIQYARQQGINILTPDINKSKGDFVIDDGAIRFGLSNLKGISSASEEIIKHQPYKSFFDFCDRVSSTIIHKGRMATLIYAGCFDQLIKDNMEKGKEWNVLERVNLVNEHRRYMKDKKNNNENQLTFGFLNDMNSVDEKDESLTLEQVMLAQIESIGIELLPDLNQQYAKEFVNTVTKLRTLRDASTGKIKYPVVLCRVVRAIPFTSRKGVEMCRVEITDGIYDAVVIMNKGKYDLNEKFFKEGNVLKLPVTMTDREHNYYLNDREDIKILPEK